MTTEYTHDLLLITPAASYTVARGIYAATTGVAADATAEWRAATDGTQALGGDWVVTHRVCHTGARATVVGQLPALSVHVPGATWHTMSDGIGTPQERVLKTRAAALLEDGLWLLEPEIGADASPTGALVRVER